MKKPYIKPLNIKAISRPVSAYIPPQNVKKIIDKMENKINSINHSLNNTTKKNKKIDNHSQLFDKKTCDSRISNYSSINLNQSRSNSKMGNDNLINVPKNESYHYN